jgi:TonB family protein
MGNELLVKLNIDRDGTAQDIQVVNSSNPALDASVVDAVRKFRFRPAKLDDQAIPVDMNLTVKVDPVGLQP